MMLPVIGGMCGLAAIVLFIMAIRTSYAIERQVRPRPAGAMPVYTNLVSSVLAIGVARDDTATRALVRRLRLQVLGVLVAFTGIVGTSVLQGAG